MLLRIGEVRSLLPRGVHLLALTATATKTTQNAVARILGMRNTLTVAIPPCKRNIVYAVVQFTSVAETLSPLLDRVKRERVSMPRVIVYCRRYEECTDLYLFLRAGLGSF